MKFTNANSFKAKIKQIAKDKGIPAQQVQQTYLIEQVLRLIAQSSYQHQFIVKGGFLIGHLLGIDKRTTMDLDMTLKGAPLSETYLLTVFEEILNQTSDGFQFEIDRLEPIRKEDRYGGYSLKLNATYGPLREVVFIDFTTGDEITPEAIELRLTSAFSDEAIEVMSYNLETILAEKLETIISRGEASTRPRDRYDLYTLYHMKYNQLDFSLLKQALENTCRRRGTLEFLKSWKEQVGSIVKSNYQKELWNKYQSQFAYAREIAFEDSVSIVFEVMEQLDNS
ncbi:TPA: nucleotidyl transferase AbiEii/AbiGii toxin family protein [Streptococcus pyogenes]|uniref:nucleotidyl transferase AbiEii/AbiGii toxin family protein n=1 Tax=Streptococcus pyogenes TaxID=1314 RepID=UPI00109D71F0|nr:nucleotidyl transferase AbiEii/AbiGii toxin family protein [Streptococcus pyogenes]QCK38912.1 nucleotidyl transferase AbiEii/AbiGii toxin family protein [Streptococcus pyogenes]VGV98237.1 abortive infection protein AbiGII [Streptococcus pyogenes]VGW88643.1 abortive infection protein AbiGII [Streptococcus pyogenes]VGZ97327.1 abortive infection protein AbiGII [Streptococcus pyogenes]VHA98765.1 abortive infection protein AbiGII [Streptococcus pyogenes]